MQISHVNPNLLLKVKVVENHYSTPLIVDTLNEYLSNSAELLFKYCGRFRAQLMCILSVYQTDHRKQLSSYSIEENQIAFMKAVSTFDYQPIKELYLDRSIIYSQVKAISRDLFELVQLETKAIKTGKKKLYKDFLTFKKEFEITIDPLILYNSVKSWLDLYITFRNSIIQNYVKFAFSKSMEVVAKSQVYLDPNETTHNFLLAVNRAIDKCDKKAGTLTSYIQSWFLNAKSNAEFDHEYGNVYHLPNSQKLKNIGKESIDNNFAISINDENNNYVLEVPESSEKIDPESIKSYDENLLLALKKVKNIRLAYLTMGIPIVLSAKEIQKLKKKSQGLVY
jgi:hypothetical protein